MLGSWQGCQGADGDARGQQVSPKPASPPVGSVLVPLPCSPFTDLVNVTCASLGEGTGMAGVPHYVPGNFPCRGTGGCLLPGLLCEDPSNGGFSVPYLS